MFSASERNQLRAELVAAARTDSRITAAALVGSAARDAEDAWSDIDLALQLGPGLDPLDLAGSWTVRLQEKVPVVAHLDVWAGPAMYRVFLLESTLQVDVSFWPADSFRATGPAFQLLFGESHRPLEPHAPEPAGLIGTAWLYALHVRSAIARRRPWQAVQMLDGMRDQVIMLACRRYDLPTHHGRGVDDLPAVFTTALGPTLVGSLDPAPLTDRFATLVALVVAEVRQTSMSDHDIERLAATLDALVQSAATDGP